MLYSGNFCFIVEKSLEKDLRKGQSQELNYIHFQKHVTLVLKVALV